MISLIKCIAEVRFPKGTLFHSAFPNSKNIYMSSGNLVSTNTGDIVCRNKLGMVYHASTGKWAEIIVAGFKKPEWIETFEMDLIEQWRNQEKKIEHIISQGPVPSERDLLIKVLAAFNLAKEIGVFLPIYIEKSIDEIRTHLQSDHH